MFSANVHMWQKVKALIRRRAKCATSNQSLDCLFLD